MSAFNDLLLYSYFRAGARRRSRKDNFTESFSPTFPSVVPKQLFSYACSAHWINATAPKNENEVFLGGECFHQLCQHPPSETYKSPCWEASAPGKLTRMWLTTEQMSFLTEITSEPSNSEPNTFLLTTRRITTTKGSLSVYSHFRCGSFLSRQWMKNILAFVFDVGLLLLCFNGECA